MIGVRQNCFTTCVFNRFVIEYCFIFVYYQIFHKKLGKPYPKIYLFLVDWCHLLVVPPSQQFLINI